MRPVVARCEVHYTGRLTALLPEAVRLLVFKADGSVLVHDDAGGYKPLNRISEGVPPEMNEAEGADSGPCGAARHASQLQIEAGILGKHCPRANGVLRGSTL